MLYFPISFEHFQGLEILLVKRLHRSMQTTSTTPSPPPYSHSFTLSSSVMNRVSTDRCALWQHTASICSKRMHRKLVNMSRKRNRKNVTRDFFYSSFLWVLFGLSISLLIVSVIMLIACSLHILLLQPMFVK